MSPTSGAREKLRWLLGELKPKGKLLTPFNVISVPIILLGAAILVVRFAYGLGAVSNLDQDYPWGLWKGFNVITGVAFAGGAYVLTFMVYVLRMERYHAIIRATVLNGLLAYMFYAGALLLDLGRPWNVINPIIGNSFGFSSVLFLVAWHFMLYMIAEFLEFSPAVAEWLGWRRVRKVLHTLTLGAVIFGISLSMLHQSGLGALYLMAKDKIHPLWYSEFIPVQFFVSSIFAGLSIVIVEGTISHKVFRQRLAPEQHFSHERILLGLSRVCAGAMFVYLFLVTLINVHGQDWQYLLTPMGGWYLLEVLGFVLVPCVLYTIAYRRRDTALVRLAAILAIVGILLNRMNVSIIAFKWDSPAHYVPSWMEVVVSLSVILTEIWVFRWIVHRMPVLSRSPEWALEQDHAAPHAARIERTAALKEA